MIEKWLIQNEMFHTLYRMLDVSYLKFLNFCLLQLQYFSKYIENQSFFFRLKFCPQKLQYFKNKYMLSNQKLFSLLISNQRLLKS